jgi:hypothetical protein
MVISSILGMLTKRGLVFSPGRIGKHRYYGSTDVLDPEKSPLPGVTFFLHFGGLVQRGGGRLRRGSRLMPLQPSRAT